MPAVACNCVVVTTLIVRQLNWCAEHLGACCCNCLYCPAGWGTVLVLSDVTLSVLSVLLYIVATYLPQNAVSLWDMSVLTDGRSSNRQLAAVASCHAIIPSCCHDGMMPDCP